MRIVFVCLVLFLVKASSTAGIIIQDTLQSTLLSAPLYYSVVVPNTYEADRRDGKKFPVVYFLHCAGCSKESWYEGSGYCPSLATLIDKHSFIAVLLDDGSRLSWWLNSPRKPTYQFSSILANEVCPTIDAHYATKKDRAFRGLTGHSMGGFGALHNLIQHPNIFSAAYSIKGGLDPQNPLNGTWGSDFGLNELLGTGDSASQNWQAVNILNNAHTLKGKSCSIAFYSGKNDTWFALENRKLDTLLTQASIPHLFTETNETHYEVSDTMFTKVLLYFDSVFTSASAIKKNPGSKKKSNLITWNSILSSSKTFTLSGRRIQDTKYSISAPCTRIHCQKMHTPHITNKP